MNELIEQLDSEEPEERQLAAFELGQTENRNAVPHLISALNDPDLYVRIYAIQGLRDIPDQSAVEPLCTTLKTSLDESLIVSNVCRALGEIKDSASVPTLLKLLEHSEPLIRYDAAQTLGEIGDPAAIAGLEAIYDDVTMPSQVDDDGAIVDTEYSVGEQAKRAVDMIKSQTEK